MSQSEYNASSASTSHEQSNASAVRRGLSEAYPGREPQIKRLVQHLARDAPPVPVIVVHGLTATGKTSITKAVLEQLHTKHVFIQCKECITTRHLLEKTLAACCDLLDSSSETSLDRSKHQKCENIAALLAHLQRLFDGIKERIVLVFDGIDRQREAPSKLEAGLIRLSEYVPNMMILYIVTTIASLTLHISAPPYVHFSAYTRKEALAILIRDPPALLTQDSATAEDNLDLWTNFCAAVWDSQANLLARDIISFREAADALWLPFVQPVLDGKIGVRAFSRLMVANRGLFQSEDVLLHKLVPAQSEKADKVLSECMQLLGTVRNRTAADTSTASDNMSYWSKYLLCAAYLASYNPSKTDPIYFMKSTDKKKRRKGGSGKTVGRASKHRKIPRRLLAPSSFPLERLLAIFHAIIPHAVAPTVDIYSQLATLTALRLLNRAGVGSGDALDPAAKWRVNASWEYVLKLGRGVGLELSEYAFEG